MWGLASVISAIFDALLAPFRGLPPIVGLAVVSVVTGVVMLLIFGRASNQTAIRRIKGRLKAHIAEIWLFRNDLGQMLLAVARVVVQTGGYFAHSLRPLVFILVPVLVIMVMLGVRYEHRPFHPGETAVVAATLSDPAWTRGDLLQLRGSAGVEVVSPPLRIPGRREVDWKIRATAPGDQELVLMTPNGEVSKRIAVAEGDGPLTKLAASRGRAFSSSFLLFPVERPLAASSGVRSIEVRGWPRHEMHILGLGVHWLIAFFAISLIAGYAVKGLFGVEV
jgi:uncharacterized membrane protein (DUF106 family)